VNNSGEVEEVTESDIFIGGTTRGPVFQ